MDARDTQTTLDRLEEGQSGVVVQLTNTGLNRRRFMDLGILPGTHIRAEFRSPLGDPTAYRIRGALIALRREQAAQVAVFIDKEDPDDQRYRTERM